VFFAKKSLSLRFVYLCHVRWIKKCPFEKNSENSYPLSRARWVFWSTCAYFGCSLDSLRLLRGGSRGLWWQIIALRVYQILCRGDSRSRQPPYVKLLFREVPLSVILQPFFEILRPVAIKILFFPLGQFLKNTGVEIDAVLQNDEPSYGAWWWAIYWSSEYINPLKGKSLFHHTLMLTVHYIFLYYSKNIS
jgi:hypothetical protein